MKGWIILALLCSALYYLYTETDKLDAPIAKTKEIVTRLKDKLDSKTGTHIIKIDQKLAKAREDIVERLSAPELTEFNKFQLAPDAITNFKETYCSAKSPQHPVFSRDNLLYICDHL